MVKELNKTTNLTTNTGTVYKFRLWLFDDFDDIKQTFKGSGLYLFTKRYKANTGYRHKYLYLGETGDFYTRYDNHHKEEDIKNNDANCIGFYSMPNSTEEERLKTEKELLNSYDFTCNDINN